MGALEKGVEALAATESCYQKMDEREKEYQRMEETGWAEKVDKSEEDKLEEEEEESSTTYKLKPMPCTTSDPTSPSQFRA